MALLPLLVACLQDESGTAFPAADLVLIDGASITDGTHSALAPDEAYAGADADGYDWTVASAGGTVYLGVPAVGEVREFVDGNLASGGTILHTGSAGERFGAAVDVRGSLLVIGAPEYDGGPALDGAGSVWVVGDSEQVGSSAEVAFGSTVAVCGDFDGAGSAGWAATAPFEPDFIGSVYQGKVGGGVPSRLAGAGAEGYGRALLCGDDLLGDEWVDLVVGAPFSLGSTGIDGAGRVEIWTHDALASFSPASVLYGLGLGAEPDEAFGSSLLVCELDGDAYLDLVVGAPGADSGAGRMYLFRGRSLRTSLTFGDIVRPTAVLYGPAPGAHFGARADCGDMSGDGVDELFVGAPGLDADDGTREVGGLYVFLGPSSDWGSEMGTDGAFANFFDDRAFLRSGKSFLVDDANGDGLVDLLMVLRQRSRGE